MKIFKNQIYTEGIKNTPPLKLLKNNVSLSQRTKIQFLKQWHSEKSILICSPFHPGHISMIIASKDNMHCKEWFHYLIYGYTLYNSFYVTYVPKSHSVWLWAAVEVNVPYWVENLSFNAPKFFLQLSLSCFGFDWILSSFRAWVFSRAETVFEEVVVRQMRWTIEAILTSQKTYQGTSM